MKKEFLTLIMILTLGCILYAAPGDTLRIVSHENVDIKTDPGIGHTDYASWVEFPADMDVRKILGKLRFECASGLNCGEWDYLNHIYIGRIGGEEGENLHYEIARYITPYGIYWRDGDGWSHDWTIDLTDWAVLLQDSVEIIYRHTGYEDNTDRGWKINLAFDFIEGTPTRKPVKVTPLWNGTYVYGSQNNSINDQLEPIDISTDNATRSASIYVLQTGHGSDNIDGCGEFCSKERTISFDGNVISRRDIWKRCGDNSLYPQAGTWLFDRANWCPGDIVTPDIYQLHGLDGGTDHTIELTMEEYSATTDLGNYVFASYLFEYEDLASANDATITRIIAPSTEKENLRFNPRCNEAIIEIKNSGSTELQSLNVFYGPVGQLIQYQWEGNLAFDESEKIYLPGQEDWDVTEPTPFIVELGSPNGQVDENGYDNRATSMILPVEVLPYEFLVKFKSTRALEETIYTIIESSTGDTAFLRDDFVPDHVHWDTVRLKPNTCYRFLIDDDGIPLSGGIDVARDGLQFWYWKALYDSNPQYGPILDYKPGYLELYDINNNRKRIKNITAPTSYSNGTANGSDFGAFLEYSFMTEMSTDMSDVDVSESTLTLYPNPSHSEFTVDMRDLEFTPQEIVIYDNDGQVVQRQVVKGKVMRISSADLTPGIYHVSLQSGKHQIQKKLVVIDGGK